MPSHPEVSQIPRIANDGSLSYSESRQYDLSAEVSASQENPGRLTSRLLHQCQDLVPVLSLESHGNPRVFAIQRSLID